MKLLYEIIVIDLPHTQYHTIRPWPLRLARAVRGLLVALLTALLLTAIRSEYAMRAVVTALSETTKAVTGAIRVVATAGRVAARVIWDDLAYEVGRVIVGNRLEGCYV